MVIAIPLDRLALLALTTRRCSRISVYISHAESGEDLINLVGGHPLVNTTLPLM